MRAGIGVDVHKFAAHRPLRLACLDWPGHEGLDGHSDADVAAHAVCDAILSACGLGDLGAVIGVDDSRWADASGAELLGHIVELAKSSGFSVVNASVQIIGNKPRLGERRSEAQAAMSAAVGAPVSVAATTSDGLGLTGRGEGLAAVATALVATLSK